MHPVLVQTIYYGILMVLTLGMVGMILKGFFWSYIRVRLSFGRLILIKVKAVNRDYFKVGWVDEGGLIYTTKFNKKKVEKRISLTDNSVFYKCLSVSWIDVDEQSNCIIKHGAMVDGFDAVKMNNLYVRALYQPQINDNREKLMMGILIILAIGIGVVLLLCWQMYAVITAGGGAGVIPGVI